MNKIIFLLFFIWGIGYGWGARPAAAWPWDDKGKVRRESYNELLNKNLGLQEKIEQLRAEADKLASMNRALLGHTKEVGRENENLKAGIETAKANLVEEKLAADKLRTAKEALALELNQAQERLIKLEKSRRGKFGYARRKIEQNLRRQYEKRTEKMRTEIKKEKAVFEKQLAFYRKKMEDAQKKAQAQEQENSRALDNLAVKYQQEQKKDKTEQEKIIAGIHAEYQSKIAALEKDFRNKQEEREKDFRQRQEKEKKEFILSMQQLERESREKISQINKEREEKEAALGKAQQALAAENEKLRSNQDTLKAGLEKKDAALKELAAKSKALSRQRDDLKLETKRLALEKERLDKKLAELTAAGQRKERDLKDKAAQLAEQVKGLQSKVSRFRSDWITTRKEKERAFKENRAYGSSNLALRDNNKQLALKIGALKSENRRLKSKVSNLRHNFKTNERIKEKSEEKYLMLKEKVDRERVDMHYNMALMFEREGLYKDAEREYLKVLAINALDAGTHYNLGILYDDYLRDIPRAIYHYKQYLEINPEGQYIYEVKEWILQAEEKIRIESKVN